MKSQKINVQRLRAIIKKFKQMKIMVIGDIMIDEYMWGEVNRISPEAPVPIVEISHISERLGGAANVVQNLSRLGLVPVLVSVVGDEFTSTRILSLLSDVHCSNEYILQSKERRTTVKTRVMAKQQQVIRADHETVKDLTAYELRILSQKFTKALSTVNSVIISDYGKGVICPTFLKKILRDCRKAEIFTAVDPKDRHFDMYKNVNIITPNLKEAHRALGIPYNANLSNDEIKAMGWKIVDTFNVSYLLLTLSERGMALYQKSDTSYHHLETVARKVYDVTGAGDTVISVFSAAFTAGASALEAAFLANHAAGIIVGEIGTASVDVQTLIKACI